MNKSIILAFNSQKAKQIWKIPKTTSKIATRNSIMLKIATTNATHLLLKQTINFQNAIPVIQTVLTNYLYATITYQTPKIPTRNVIRIFQNLRIYNQNAMTSYQLPRTIYLLAAIPFRFLKPIWAIAIKNIAKSQILWIVSISNSKFAMLIYNNAN